MKESFFISAGISAFIMAVWFFISSLFPSPTIQYLQNEYKTDNIEIVWESKADSAYCALDDLTYLNGKVVRVDNIDELNEAKEKLNIIECIMDEQKSDYNTISKTIRFKADGKDYYKIIYYDNNVPVTDNDKLLDKYKKTLEYFNSAEDRILPAL